MSSTTHAEVAAIVDSAKLLFVTHPHFGAPGASIELREIMSMPGKQLSAIRQARIRGWHRAA